MISVRRGSDAALCIPRTRPEEDRAASNAYRRRRHHEQGVLLHSPRTRCLPQLQSVPLFVPVGLHIICWQPGALRDVLLEQSVRRKQATVGAGTALPCLPMSVGQGDLGGCAATPKLLNQPLRQGMVHITAQARFLTFALPTHFFSLIQLGCLPWLSGGRGSAAAL